MTIIDMKPDDDGEQLDRWIEQHPNGASLAEVLEAMREQAGVDKDDALQIPILDRFDMPVSGLRWSCGQPPPGGTMDDHVIVAIHVGDQADRLNDHAESEVRVYVMPRSVRDPQGNPNPFFKYSFSRVPGAGAHRALLPTLKLFLEELVYEYEQLAIVFGILEEEETPEAS
jgi:hypothetical protein